MPKLTTEELERNVPGGMKALSQWCGWMVKDGRKTPINARTGRLAKSNDPKTWSPWEDALDHARRHERSERRGLGFVFQKSDGLVYVDLDDCLDEGRELLPWARELVLPFLKKTYVEVSPGGRGLHVFAIAHLPPGASAITGKRSKVADGLVEVYHDRRFTTVTGDVFKGSSAIGLCQAEVDALLKAVGLWEKMAEREAPGPGDAAELTPETLAQVRAALAALDPDVGHDQWVKIGMALKSGLGDELGFSTWNVWSARGAKYKGEHETRAKWKTFATDGGVKLGSLFYVAEEEAGFQTGETPEEAFKGYENLPEERREPYERGSLQDWKKLGLHLYLKGSGKNAYLAPSEGDANLGIWLERGRWADQLRYNERTMEAERRDGERVDLHELVRESVFFMDWRRSPGEESVLRAVEGASSKNRHDPVREWLETLKWDGTQRMMLLCNALGLEDTPLTVRGMCFWMIGAVARAYRPGCKMQTMLVLHGAQGKLKSTLLEKLAVRPEWYSESHIDMSSKDGELMLLGPWIAESAELTGMSKAEVDKVKVFISESVSRFRRPYGRKTESHPRRCVLCGTTNENEFLRDATGARRFHIVEVYDDVELRVELLTPEYVAQLWAEAKAAYQEGARWWETGPEVRERIKENERFFEGTSLDARVRRVIADLASKRVTTVQEVQRQLCDRDRVPLTLRDRDVASAMKRAGWTRAVLRAAGEQRRFWVAPKVVGDVSEDAESALRRATEEFAPAGDDANVDLVD